MTRLAYRVHEVAAALGIGESTVRDWIARGRLRSVREGRLRLIPASELERLRRELGGEAVAPVRSLAAREGAAALLDRMGRA